tara:strand:- start:479 stop:802 length:324 start_codon:yes stop_codon:yes gene_type:complete
MSTVNRKENKMPVFKVFMEFNRPMYGEFYVGMEKGKELDDFVIENFLHWNIECLELEEDFHTDHTYDIHECLHLEDDTKLDIWWINEAGEQIERPKPEPIAVQLELF